ELVFLNRKKTGCPKASRFSLLLSNCLTELVRVVTVKARTTSIAVGVGIGGYSYVSQNTRWRSDHVLTFTSCETTRQNNTYTLTWENVYRIVNNRCSIVATDSSSNVMRVVHTSLVAFQATL